MNEMIQKAIDKLNEESKNANHLSTRAKLVISSVHTTLQTFCEQNAEFAQAVVQTDKTLAECVEETVKNASQAISDIDVYRKAADFYFSGATVEFKMIIKLGDDGFSNEQTANENAKPKELELSLDLDKLLDF